MALVKFLVIGILLSIICNLRSIHCEEDVEDFDFTSKSHLDYGYEEYQDGEIEPKQESSTVKRYNNTPKYILKPNVITNSHKPQYNIDLFEDEPYAIKPIDDITEDDVEEIIHKIEEDEESKNIIKDKYYSPSHQLRAKEEMIREAVVKALERKDHIKKFAQMLPIIRAMSSNQRLALASLVANQVTTPPGRKGLNLVQVRSMFGNNDNTTADLMLPILLDMANLFRKASRPGKEPRSAVLPSGPSNIQMLRRSDDGDKIIWDDDPRANTSEVEVKESNDSIRRSFVENDGENKWVDASGLNDIKLDTTSEKAVTTTTTQKSAITNSLRSKFSARARSAKIQSKNTNKTSDIETKRDDQNKTQNSKSTLTVVFPNKIKKTDENNSSIKADEDVENKNETVVEDNPVAEKLRGINRRVHPNRRQPWSPTATKSNEGTRRVNTDVSSLLQRRRPTLPKKLQPVPKPINEQGNCELFTNNLCLDAENYPTEAIVTSIRRNKAAAGALLADFEELDQVDGVSADEETKYTPEHYINLNRRGDSGGSIRDFAGAGEAGFMCPSTVKYARPQRARATSGQWKYIVNTGEHTQTLRLEKCLRPKESCTYLTDNFKSKCVQVYNYHRLLTWDQQNGLHMDIFKVPTCCSCHIEGYSVSFPPLGHRAQETSSEHYPGEDVNENVFESGQSTMVRPNVHTTPFSLVKPVETFNLFGDNQNSISGNAFNSHTYTEDFNTPVHPSMDSYGNSYFPDNYKQGSGIRNVKKPTRNKIPDGMFESSVTLPSYLEPPSESSMPVASTFFGKGSDSGKPHKYPLKYVRPVKRPHRRPIRKKISGADDLMGTGTIQIESPSHPSMIEAFDDIPLDDAVAFDIRNNKGTTEPPRKLIHKLPIYTSTTEGYSTADDSIISSKDVGSNKRVNYNYHPIIDFFENNSNKDESFGAIDRGDSVSTFNPEIDSDWRPMNFQNVKTNKIGKASLSH